MQTDKQKHRHLPSPSFSAHSPLIGLLLAPFSLHTQQTASKVSVSVLASVQVDSMHAFMHLIKARRVKVRLPVEE